jgi:hypothetical protein
MQHHDIHPMPNGNVLMIAWELKTYAQSIAAGRRPDMLEDSVLWPDYIVEVNQATDSIVWHWHMWDHIIQDYDSTKPNYGIVGDHPELIDLNQGERMAIWSHVNSIDYNADLDQIMLSARGYSEAWVIDHSTTNEEAAGHTGGRGGRGGDLLYRWGNPQVYDRGNANDQRLYSQHDAHWIEKGLPGAGNILVFNNGNGRPGGQYSSVDEFVPPVDSLGHYYLPPGRPLPLLNTRMLPAPGSPFSIQYGPTQQLWVYRGDFYSEAISGAQRLPNGNTLVDDGVHGIFSEVTPDTEIVWLYVNPVINTGPMWQGDSIPLDIRGHRYNAVFKLHRYAPDYPGLEGRDLTPQGPIERYHPAVEEETRTIGPRTRLLSSAPGVLTIADAPAEGTVEFYSVAGRLLLRSSFVSPDPAFRLDLKSLPAGACLCVVKDADGGVVLRAKAVITR